MRAVHILNRVVLRKQLHSNKQRNKYWPSVPLLIISPSNFAHVSALDLYSATLETRHES
jgi:hypothetical protein